MIKEQVRAAALEVLVLLDAHAHEQVARRSALRARVSLPVHTQDIPVADALGNADADLLVVLQSSLAAALDAGIGYDLAGATTPRACLLHAEEALLEHDLAASGALRAGRRRCAGPYPITLAGATQVHLGYVNGQVLA